MLALCPPSGIELLGQAMTYGAKKYGQHNYLGGIAYTRLLSACLRHVFSYVKGEDNDLESGLSHIGHALACLSMLAEMTRIHPELDDRFKLETERQPKVVEPKIKQTNGETKDW